MAGGDKGCGCGAIVLVVGILLVLLVVGGVLMGVSRDGEFDFTNPFGIMDAVDYDLEPVMLQPTEEGGLHVEFDLIRTGATDWTWTDLDLTNERLGVGESWVDLKRLSPIPSDYPMVIRLAFETGPIETTDGDAVRVRMGVRIKAERFGGASSINMNRDREQKLGEVGAWYDHAAETAVVPAVEDAGGPDEIDG